MPNYAFRCGDGHDFDVYLKYADYDRPQTCRCGKPAARVICAPMVFLPRDIYYESPIDGRVIRSKQQRLDDLARHGCVEYDPGMKQDSERRRKEDDEKLDRSIEETVEREIHQMPPRKREQLTAEIKSGATAEAVRMEP